MAPVKITSFRELRAWNREPEGKPEIASWFFDWWFDHLENQRLFICCKGYYAILEFTCKCEHMDTCDAVRLIQVNMLAWASRGPSRHMHNLKGFYDYLKGQ